MCAAPRCGFHLRSATATALTTTASPVTPVDLTSVSNAPPPTTLPATIPVSAATLSSPHAPAATPTPSKCTAQPVRALQEFSPITHVPFARLLYPSAAPASARESVRPARVAMWTTTPTPPASSASTTCRSAQGVDGVRRTWWSASSAATASSRSATCACPAAPPYATAVAALNVMEVATDATLA